MSAFGHYIINPSYSWTIFPPLPLSRLRKLYISRKNSDYRQLINSEEIEDALVARGFEIIFPEHLSFFAQVQLFSEAELIVGQSGAGMASFIFAPKDCEILMMMSDASQSNLHIFGALADSIGLSLKYILGKHINIKKSKCRRRVYPSFPPFWGSVLVVPLDLFRSQKNI